MHSAALSEQNIIKRRLCTNIQGFELAFEIQVELFRWLTTHSPIFWVMKN
jgi:hypothetical protein